MFVFAAAATTFANSVLPEPGGPSARIGFCICAARNTTFKVTGSATYLAAASFSDKCSIEVNKGCAPAALILNQIETETLFFRASKYPAAQDRWRSGLPSEKRSNHSPGCHSGHSGWLLHDEAHSYTMIAVTTRVQ